MAWLGTVDLVLSVLYSALLVAVLVLTYRLLIHRKSGD
jgi:hypothetical protein